MRFLISTTCRKASLNESSGHLYVFDSDEWKTIQKGSIIEPPFREFDPNPRGGIRGGKGIAITKDHLLLSNAVAVFHFNHDWILQNVITHPSCAGIHDILLDSNQHLWVTSARNDLLFKFNLTGDLLDFYNFRDKTNPWYSSIYWNRSLLTQEDIIEGRTDFRDPRTHSQSFFDSTHVNGICSQLDGSILVSLGLVVSNSFSVLSHIKEFLIRKGYWDLIIRINKFIINLFSLKKKFHSELIFTLKNGKSVVVCFSPGAIPKPCFEIKNLNVPSHSLLARPDGSVLYLNTSAGELVHFRPAEQQPLSLTRISSTFLRGITHLSNNHYLIGTQNKLYLFNLDTLCIENSFKLSDNLNEIVFSIHKYPESLSLPPKSFLTHLGELEGFDGRYPIFVKD